MARLSPRVWREIATRRQATSPHLDLNRRKPREPSSARGPRMPPAVRYEPERRGQTSPRHYLAQAVEPVIRKAGGSELLLDCEALAEKRSHLSAARSPTSNLPIMLSIEVEASRVRNPQDPSSFG